MLKVLLIILGLFSSKNLFSCEFLNKDETELNNLMGKKSKFYDAYKQGECVLENALKPLSIEQKELIASLIAKKYKNLNSKSK